MKALELINAYKIDKMTQSDIQQCCGKWVGARFHNLSRLLDDLFKMLIKQDMNQAKHSIIN